MELRARAVVLLLAGTPTHQWAGALRPLPGALPLQQHRRLALLQPPAYRPAAAAAPRARAVARMAAPAALNALWPNTLAKFWGAHAIAWSVSALSLAALGRTGPLLSAAAVPFATSNLALAVLLYRTNEEAGQALGAAGLLSFAGVAAFLHAGSRLSLGGAALRAARAWHMALAAGSAAFAFIKANKDRMFVQQGDLLRTGMLAGTSRGAALPLLVVVNQGAGAKLGAKVAAELRERAEVVVAKGGAMRVVDVADTPPATALAAFAAEHAAFRVLVCGGDGTATWVLQAIDDARLAYRPAVAVMPLGTGNDLARVLGWGKSYRNERMGRQLAAIDRARVALLDRWSMRGTLRRRASRARRRRRRRSAAGAGPGGRGETVLCNYLSIGVDAKAALLWARLAKARPGLFRLRLLNKLWYIVCGAPEVALHSFRRLDERVTLECDGEAVAIPPSAEGIMVLNTPSYGGGSDLWDQQRQAPLATRLRWMQTADAAPASMNDGMLEAVAVTDVVHLANALGGFSNGVRLCQGRTLRIRAAEAGIPLQVDGEPFNVDGAPSLRSTANCEPFDFTLQRDLPQAFMLAAPQLRTPQADVGAGELAIERGVAAGALSAEVRDELLRDMAA